MHKSKEILEEFGITIEIINFAQIAPFDIKIIGHQ